MRAIARPRRSCSAAAESLPVSAQSCATPRRGMGRSRGWAHRVDRPRGLHERRGGDWLLDERRFRHDARPEWWVLSCEHHHGTVGEDVYSRSFLSGDCPVVGNYGAKAAPTVGPRIDSAKSSLRLESITTSRCTPKGGTRSSTIAIQSMPPFSLWCSEGLPRRCHTSIRRSMPAAGSSDSGSSGMNVGDRS